VTPDQVQIIKSTFAEVLKIKDKAGLLFYERLFAIAPETKPLFKGDIAEQSRKLMDTLALAIGMLRDMPTLVQTLQTLALRHVRYGVKSEHYDKVGAALLWTLEQGLGPKFTPKAREAWTALYGAVAKIMIDAAQTGPKPATT
jgi:hemoglobin-like flavoprotein